MTICSDAKFPTTCGTLLSPSLDKLVVDLKIYQSMIGVLLYLTTSRPNTMFSVFNCARYKANPIETHLIAVKNIFPYLQRTPTLGLWYPGNTEFFIQAFSDADLGGCQLDRKSTTGGCQFLGGKLVSWQSKKQTSVSISTMEAEYITIVACTSQLIWIRSQLCDYTINMKKILYFVILKVQF